MRVAIAIALALVASCAAAQHPREPALDGLERAEWIRFYERARKGIEVGDTDGIAMAFYAGQLRARTSVLCYHPGEPNEAELLGTLNATMGEAINPVIGRSVKGWTGILDRVLAWEDAHPDPSTANAKCAAARADVRRGLITMRDELRADPGAVRRKRAANGLPNDPE